VDERDAPITDELTESAPPTEKCRERSDAPEKCPGGSSSLSTPPEFDAERMGGDPAIVGPSAERTIVEDQQFGDELVAVEVGDEPL